MDKILQAFTQHSLYIIGAGVSAGIIPMTANLTKAVRDSYWRNGTFPVDKVAPDELINRLRVRGMEDMPPSLKDWMLSTISPGATQAFAIKNLTVDPMLPVDTMAYDVFSRAKKSIMFNFNTDGLCNKYCKKHQIFDLHGTLPADLIHTLQYEEYIQNVVVYNWRPLDLGVLLPLREPKGISQTQKYYDAAVHSGSTTFTVIIGYSFGYDGQHFDDYESMEFICSILKRKTDPVLIIDLHRAQDISDMLQDKMKIKTIFPIHASWRRLASAINEKCNGSARFSNRNLEYIYRSIVDRSGI
jgi:hypothetical protein